MNANILQILLGIVFLTVVFLLVSKKNSEAAIAYAVQSFAIVLIIFNSFLRTGDITLLLIALLMLVVKVVASLIFNLRLINKHKLKFTVNTYLSTPITIIVIAVLTTIAHSEKLLPLTMLEPDNNVLLAMALSIMFLSLFLIVNSKGALSQILGVLSLENSIVAFAVFAGLEQSAGLQLGIIFDILVWIVIATIFISMIYKHFGSLDVTSMKQLRD